MKIAFVGTGNLLEALLAGAIRGEVPREWLTCSAHTVERATWLVDHYGVRATTDNQEAVRDASLVLVGVRPDEILAVIHEISPDLRPGAVVASASASTELADLREALPETVAVCRIMPSVAARVGHGICGVAFAEPASADQRELVATFLGAMGEVQELPEDRLGTLGALAGSGPAYLAKLIEAMVAGGVELGIEPDEARRLTLAAVVGTAALLEPDPDGPRGTLSFDDVAAAVGHPGGSTIRSVAHLRDSGALAAVQAAVSHSFEA